MHSLGSLVFRTFCIFRFWDFGDLCLWDSLDLTGSYIVQTTVQAGRRSYTGHHTLGQAGRHSHTGHDTLGQAGRQSYTGRHTLGQAGRHSTSFPIVTIIWERVFYQKITHVSRRPH